MTPEDKAILFRVADWIDKTKRKRVETIRQLAGTEEHYLILITEFDRVDAQVRRARTLHADATLTLVDWFSTLEYFDWRCAYCQEKPFQIMSHVLPLPQGGTTAENCVPACYGCGRARRKADQHVQAYLAHVKDRYEQMQMVEGGPPLPTIPYLSDNL